MLALHIPTSLYLIFHKNPKEEEINFLTLVELSEGFYLNSELFITLNLRQTLQN